MSGEKYLLRKARSVGAALFYSGDFLLDIQLLTPLFFIENQETNPVHPTLTYSTLPFFRKMVLICP